MTREEAKEYERKGDRFLRELVLFMAAISIFPFMTVRVLVWKWHVWIRESELRIKEDHEDFENLKHLPK